MIEIPALPEAVQARLAPLAHEVPDYMGDRYTLALTAIVFPAADGEVPSQLRDFYASPTIEAGRREDGDPAWARAIGLIILLRTYETRPGIREISAMLRSGRAIEMAEEALGVDRASQITGCEVVAPWEAATWLKTRTAGPAYECGPLSFWIVPA